MLITIIRDKCEYEWKYVVAGLELPSSNNYLSEHSPTLGTLESCSILLNCATFLHKHVGGSCNEGGNQCRHEPPPYRNEPPPY